MLCVGMWNLGRFVHSKLAFRSLRASSWTFLLWRGGVIRSLPVFAPIGDGVKWISTI